MLLFQQSELYHKLNTSEKNDNDLSSIDDRDENVKITPNKENIFEIHICLVKIRSLIVKIIRPMDMSKDHLVYDAIFGTQDIID